MRSSADQPDDPSDAHALALATPHRFVVIASPRSMAWTPAFRHGIDVFVLDPLREADADVIGPLQPPNDGPGASAMPRWAVYDCAEIPGAVIGLLRSPVASPYSRPLDPLAIVLATPHAEPDAWHLYGITVRASSADSPGIRCAIVRHAIDLLRAEQVTLVVPWRSRLLPRLAAAESVELLSARTPMHGPPPAATVVVHGDRTRGPHAGTGAGSPLPADDTALVPWLDGIQARLDDDERLLVGTATDGDSAARDALVIRGAPR